MTRAGRDKTPPNPPQQTTSHNESRRGAASRKDPTGIGNKTTHHSHQWPATRKKRHPHSQDPLPPATSDESQPGSAGGSTHKALHRAGRMIAPASATTSPNPQRGGEQHQRNRRGTPPPRTAAAAGEGQGQTITGPSTRSGEGPPHPTGSSARTGEGPPVPDKIATYLSKKGRETPADRPHPTMTGWLQAKAKADHTPMNQATNGVVRRRPMPTHTYHKSGQES